MHAIEVLNSSEKKIMRKIGLEVRKIKLNLQDNEDEVFKKLCYRGITTGDGEENFPVGYPHLSDCGVFELMVSQTNSSQLNVLDCTLSSKNRRKSIQSVY